MESISRIRTHIIAANLFLLCSILPGLFPAKLVNAYGENLISNPGFESGVGNIPASWSLDVGADGNNFDWVSDDVHAGHRALKMTSINPPASGKSMSVNSNPFKVSAHCRVEALIWMKADNVVKQGNATWYGLRVTLSAYDRSDNKIQIELPLLHEDIISQEGSFPWKKIQGGMIAPEGTEVMRLSVKLTTSTGTVLIDDAEVKIVQEVPTVNLTEIYNPVLIPQPWQIKYGNEKLKLEDIAVVKQFEDDCTGEAIDSFFTSIGVIYKFFKRGDADIAEYSTQLILGDRTDPVLDKKRSAKFPDYDWSDLGEQGYFLTVERGQNHNIIYVGANSEIGRFYAVQTIKQLIMGKNIYCLDIFDKPAVNRRGIPMGFHWFKERKGEALKRLTELKLNFVWNQGTFLNNYFSTDNWRLPFSDSQKAIIKEYIDLYQRNFIEVWMSIGPRGKDQPLQYSSDNDINTVVNKMDVLYSLGLRNFGLNFDDLVISGENALLVREDIEFFNNDIIAAQSFFIKEVYTRLKNIHHDINFMVVPMNYCRAGNYGDEYESKLLKFKELPAGIRIYAVPYYDEDILATTGSTGRSAMTVWSNFYVEGYSNFPEFVIPYVNFINWEDPLIRMKIDGFTWLPQILKSEDAALISWHTVADFAWAPERYDPYKSFQLAAARYLGVSDGIHKK